MINVEFPACDNKLELTKGWPTSSILLLQPEICLS